MLTQFPVGFSIAQLCITLAADMNKQLWDTNCNIYTILLFFLFFRELLATRMQTQKSIGLKGHPSA